VALGATKTAQTISMLAEALTFYLA